MKKISTFLVLLLCLINVGFLSKLYGQAATLPYTQNFSTSNDLTLTNGTQTNKWVYGSAVGNAANSLYISNDNGVTNAYTTASATSIVQAYRDIIIPTGTTTSIFAFDWKGDGESTYDLLRVWLVPTTYTPVAGTTITAGAGRIQVGGNFNQQTTWQNYLNTNLNLSTFAGSTMRLVFEWKNDGSGGNQPPAAIDNINLLIPTCFMPTPLAPTAITAATATISWTAPTPAPANGYAYYVSTSNVPPTAATVPTGTTAAGVTTANVAALTPNTTYYWWVRSVCGPTDNSLWTTGASFLTAQIPTTLPYTQNFNTSNDLGYTTGNQVNKWAYGSVVGNAGNSIYISNDNGVTNSYNTSSSVAVHAYRDITIPTGTTLSTLTFDWKGDGESTYDLLKVWLVPISYMPVAGTGITAGAGRIQVGGSFNQQTTWQNYLNTNVNLTTFAGLNMRLVFEWINDGSGGTQPPIAVDNINLFIPTCFVPTAMGVGTVGSSTSTINWTAPTPAPGNGYAYYLSTSSVPPTAATTPTGTTAAGVTTANLTGLTPNTTYYWWVRSVYLILWYVLYVVLLIIVFGLRVLALQLGKYRQRFLMYRTSTPLMI
ncbi:hypothetical protein [Chryseobacterium sp. ERMR1:04]|uniref:fibronectin type III domain-containing protein n=1 Tax=Chryseobacterium sp. ERMR1:04 TaxID=1705393 RepID=UPI000A7B15F6|nr:hypothetical protein [Chryseobacterium sp. ERMR1:04]